MQRISLTLSSCTRFFIKLQGTEFIISHTFQCGVTFPLLVLKNLNKYHMGDFAGHCSIYCISCKYAYILVATDACMYNLQHELISYQTEIQTLAAVIKISQSIGTCWKVYIYLGFKSFHTMKIMSMGKCA